MYYTEECYEEETYEAGKHTTIIERFPYQAIRERPDPGSFNGSYEIGRTHSKGWADLIVAALNAHYGAEQPPAAERTKGSRSGGGR